MSADHFGPHEAREAGEALPGLTSRVVIYTTAPRDYDWQFTRELDANVGIASNGKVIRKVEIETSRAEHQCQRYASGLHMAADPAEWAKLVSYKLVTLASPGES